MKLAGKVALITGGAQGIGLACAQAFVAEGARVVLVDRDEKRGQEALGKLGGENARFLAADVTHRGVATQAIEAAVSAFGGLDILLNNAGITHTADFLDLTEEDFDRVMAVNLRACFTFGQAVARHLVQAGRPGSIINLSSVNAVVAIANQTPYCVSKGGINMLTRVMAISLARRGIRVNAIGPGTIATDLARKAVLDSPQALDTLLSRTPLGRLGEPEEIGRVAVFLASEESSYFTGQTLYPDGGRLALNYVMPPLT